MFPYGYTTNRMDNYDQQVISHFLLWDEGINGYDIFVF